MLHDILRRIMLSEQPDNIKQTLIINTLLPNQSMNRETCEETLKLGLSWVLEGNKPLQIEVGWMVLKFLKDYQDLISKKPTSSEVKELLTLSNSVYNCCEIPLLIAWWLDLLPVPDAQEMVRFHITDFLKENAHCGIMILVNTSKLLLKYPDCIPTSIERVKFCERMVISIAELPMPKAQGTEVAQLIKQVSSVQELLGKIRREETCEINEELMFKCLQAVHKAIIECSSDPCPALASILHLVDPQLITKAVKAILQANEGQSRTLRTLCEWLLSWPNSSRLQPWVLTLMDGLEAEREFNILNEVTLSLIEKLFTVIVLSLLRPGVMGVVWRMLASTRYSDKVFLKILNRIPGVTTRLIEEDSESSRLCLQMIVNMSYYMMSVFPRTDTLYNPVVQTMKECIAFLPPGQFVPEEFPKWTDDLEIDLAGFQMKERSSSRVGLNNLGNTCYMNSVLQALFMTNRFCHMVLDGDSQAQPLLVELQSLFALLIHSKRRAISPLKLLTLAKPPGFLPGHQQDSSEFLIYFLDVLHEQEKLSASVTNTVIGDGAGDDGTEGETMEIDRRDSNETDVMDTTGGGAMTRWTTEEDLSNQNILQRKARSLADFTQTSGDVVEQLSNFHSNSTDSGIQSVFGDDTSGSTSSPVPYESLVQQCFGGRLLMSFRCLHCQAESVHTDHFRDIQLAFPPGCSLIEELEIQDLLDYFISPEKLTGENQYRCDSCNSLQDAQQSIRILQSPSHLVLTLKRFQFNSRTGQRAKLLHQVRCSENIMLHQQPYLLYAAVVHSGRNMDTGHYYTLARDEIRWHIFNDSLVSPCGPPPWSITDTPYILFYMRPEESLHPAVNFSMLRPLNTRLTELVHRDHSEWLREVHKEEEKRKKRRKKQPSFSGPHNSNEDDDCEGKPPGNCGGGGLELHQNRFVY